MKRKVCVVITARPSYSRIKTVLQAIQRHPGLELQLVVAASALLDRYGTAVNVIEEDGFQVDAKVFMVLEGENPTSMAKTTGLGLLEMATVFDNLRPSVVVTIADRFETLATAIASSYMNLPLAHVQGGEVTGSIDEKVRHAVTKLADLHFVANRQAGERVIRMGENPDRVFITGCPSIDLAKEVAREPTLTFNPLEKYGGVGAEVDISGEFLVVMQHPVTTEHQGARKHALQSLHAVKEVGLPTLWFWPNVDAGSDGTSNAIRSFRESEKPSNIRFFKNMAPLDFLRLIKNSACLVGNSSVGIREAAFLGVPVVNIGTRQAGRERATNVIDVGYRSSEIVQAINQQRQCGPYEEDHLYGDGDAGQRIANLLCDAPLDFEKRLMY